MNNIILAFFSSTWRKKGRLLLAIIWGIPFLSFGQLSVEPDNLYHRYDPGEMITYQVLSSTDGVVDYIIHQDPLLPPLAQGTIAISAGDTTEIQFTPTEPGNYFCIVTLGAETASTVAVSDMRGLAPFAASPADFDTYWGAIRTQLDAEPIDAQVVLDTDVNFQSAYSKTYRLSLGSIDGHRAYAYMTVPETSGVFTGLIKFPAFGNSDAAQPDLPMSERLGAIVISLSIHNSPVNVNLPNEQTYVPDITTTDTVYYQWAIAAGMRAIDYLETRSDFDQIHVGVYGVSQGAGLAMLLAGVDSRVDLLAISNPILSQHDGLKYDEPSGFPKYIRNYLNDPVKVEQILSKAKYYDNVFAAQRFSGPVLATVSLKDEVTPAECTNVAMNQLDGKIVRLHNLEGFHADNPPEYWDGKFDMIRRYFPTNYSWPNAQYHVNEIGYEANAGNDQTFNSLQAVLSGTIDDNGTINPPNIPVHWELVSGPGMVTFSSPNSHVTTATFSQSGIYNLRFVGEEISNLTTGSKYLSIEDMVTLNICSVPMPGYTKLGEFEGHGYYLSDTIMNWVDADAYTKANGQFLVSINSQEENDFIHALVSELVLIGLSDLDVEGEPTWTNGDSVIYTNYSDCSWCATNDVNHNFGVMLPWDGTWIFDHYFRNARHIVELPCGQITSEMTITCPDDIWMELPANQLSLPITWDLPTVTTDCVVNDTIIISQTSGASSGSDFITGIYTIGYQAIDSCSSLAECTFTVTITVPQDTGCGDIAGFTKLGEFEGHGYYMSDAASTWADARDFAQAAGGHLVTMNSKNENDFVQLHLGNEMVFIGYNDEAVEGTGTWANGEPVTLDLSYGNDAESDYAVMNFWNGKWVMVNQYVYKKYILEMDCGGPSPTSITLNCPANMEVTLPTDSLYMDITWELPQPTTTCMSDVVTLTQTLGNAPGAAFEQGNHTITYAATDSCGNLETCSFEITVHSEGSCGPIAGYTLLGEYNGHAYYLSDAALPWVDAQFTAATDGGYLATMNTQEENDFLQGVIGTTLPFIGYSDVVTEGEGTWANEDSVAIDLSFSNSDENDFAVMNFWAGTWQMVNQWVVKKYVMEMSCGNIGGATPAAPMMVTQYFKPSIHSIYPNPADDYITVRLTNDKELDANFTIYDARGQVFLTEKRNLPKGASELEFEISKLPAGMYFLQLGQGAYQRFVKMD